jgi:peptide/nickel transport system substrate-binding protein
MFSIWLKIQNFFQNSWHGLKNLRDIDKARTVAVLESLSKSQIRFGITAALIVLISGGFLITRLFADRGPGPHFGGELTEGVVGQPQFINPILAAGSSVDSDLTRIVYAQLLKFDANETLAPDLALSLPEISEDQKTFTLRLKPDLKWQDGKPLTADDVIFTIQSIQNSEYESALRANWIRIKIEKIDDLTITFQLNEVSSSFINNFALGILPKHLWENLTPRNFRLSDQNLKAIGSGPFQIETIRKTADGTIKSATLKANPLYHEGRPYLNRITIKFYNDYESLLTAYQGREIQAVGLVPFDKSAFLTAHNQSQVRSLNLPQYQAVFLNVARNPILAEKAVRQALWLVTDREQIIDDIYSNNVAPAYGPILPESLGFNPEIEKTIHYSLAEADDILNRAGWAMNTETGVRVKKGTPLEFNLVTSGNLVLNVKTGQVIQEQWAKIGAKVNLIIVSPRQLQEEYIRGRSFDAILTSENTGADPDPFPFWHTSQSHDPGLNLTGFTNAESDRLLTQARQTNDVNIRSANYQRFQEIINQELPAIFLTRSLFIYTTPKSLGGVDLNNIIHPSERFLDINRWYFQK